ncbi:hypothetical protein K438DRAFT_1956419 [Mycena galopus ATCC 62051]|nr:hypothetical protein K438DRAFT_1956419 [Mycena galopus ATCC 62051]
MPVLPSPLTSKTPALNPRPPTSNTRPLTSNGRMLTLNAARPRFYRTHAASTLLTYDFKGFPKLLQPACPALRTRAASNARLPTSNAPDWTGTRSLFFYAETHTCPLLHSR